MFAIARLKLHVSQRPNNRKRRKMYATVNYVLPQKQCSVQYGAVQNQRNTMPYSNRKYTHKPIRFKSRSQLIFGIHFDFGQSKDSCRALRTT